jgi:hypothetical protein
MSANIVALGDESAELMLHHSMTCSTLRGNISKKPRQPTATVAPEPAQVGDAEAPADQPAAAAVAGVRMSAILTPTPHSMLANLYRTNVMPTVSSTCTIGELLLLYTTFEWISDRLDMHNPSLYAFVSGLMLLVVIRAIREKDKLYGEAFRLMFPVAVATSCCILWLAENGCRHGDTGAFTTPLVALMFTTQSAARWALEPQPRPNVLKYYLECIPIAIILTILTFLPQYAVTVPGRLLAKHPVAYMLWTGVGYPVFAFVLRKAGLSHWIGYARKKVESGLMPPKDVVPFVSGISLALTTTLMFGNIMLLYLSDDVYYALLGSVTSIFTEVAGKLYVIWSTERSMKVYLGARGFTRKVLAAQAEPGVNATIRIKGGGKPDERLREEHWEDVRAMMALRWTNEIVCEKCCIMVGAVVTMVLIESQRTTQEQIVVTLVFLATEFVTDALLVYCLDRWFDVPFRRMPLTGKLKSPEFWNDVKLTVLCIGMGSFVFKHAFETAVEWFPDVVGAAAGGAMGANATSIANNATSEAFNTTLP